jgi:hypothetical protein
LQNSTSSALGPGQFLGESLTKRSGSLAVEISKEAGMAVPVIIPSGIVEDRIETDSVDRDACLLCRENLMTNDAKPSRAQVALNSGLGNKERPPIALVDVTKEITEGTKLPMVDRDRQVSVNPLIVKIVIHSNDVDVVGSASELRALSS